MAFGRVQRRALTQVAYRYSVVNNVGKAHSNADPLSHLPLPDTPIRTPDPDDDILMMQVLESTPVDSKSIKSETSRDSV